MLICNRNKDALEVYELGIARKAQPLSRLTRHYQEFQKRMMLTMTATEVKKDTNSVDTETHTVLQTQSTILKKSKTLTASVNKSSERTFQVFCDPEGDQSQPRVETLMPSASSANAWDSYADEATKIKENIKQPDVWSGSTLPQQSQPRPLVNKLPVFKDEV